MGQWPFSNSSEIRRRIPEPTPEQIEEYERLAREKQEGDPFWKKFLRGAVDTVGGAAQGMLGMEPKPQEFQDPGSYSNLLVQAGIPFSTYKAAGKLPFGKVFHGTQRAFNRFDPTKNSDDFLGWMIHAAENPAEADLYTGAPGGYRTANSIYDTPDKKIGIKRPNIIPITPDSKNVFDLTNSNSDDVSQMLASMNSENRQILIDQFKTLRKNKTTPGMATNELAYEFPSRLIPEEFNKSPFDSIRYGINSKESAFAIPPTTPIKSAISGVDMSPTPEMINKFLAPTRSNKHLPPGVNSRAELSNLYNNNENMTWEEYKELEKLLPNTYARHK